MKINNFRGDLSDISAKTTSLAVSVLLSLTLRTAKQPSSTRGLLSTALAVVARAQPSTRITSRKQ